MEKCVQNLIHCSNIADLHSHLPDNSKVITLIDPVVEAIYGQYLPHPRITVDASESNKSISKTEELALELLNMGADRETFLLGVGGGIITDLTGFLASVYMRGVRFGFIPTTLLAQVDASIGGKNGVNVKGYKNILGIFRKPEFVLVCKDFLKSLPEKEIRNGLSELLKTFLVSDREGFFSVLDVVEKYGYDTVKLSPLVDKAANIKLSITERDPCDRGERELLNLGHTFGHALEKICGIPHGEAVSIGIVTALSFSEKLGLISGDDAKAIRKGMEICHLSTVSPVPLSSLKDAVVHDKKKSGSTIRLILPTGIGKAVVQPVEVEMLEIYIYDLS